MKKLLLMIPLSFSLALFAQDNNTNTDKSAAPQSKEQTKDKSVSPVLATLDGKAFKITIVNRDAKDVPAANVPASGTGDNKDVAVTTAPDATTPATAPNTATPPTPSTTASPATTNPDGTVTPPVDNTSASTETHPESSMESLNKKKMILSFENGTIHSPGLATTGIDNCAYHINSSDGNIASFSSNCKSSVIQVKGMWSGIVEGNNIRGNFTLITDDGKNVYYTFSGTKATQKDIAASQELGAK